MNNKNDRKNKEFYCSIITSICKITIVQPFDFLRFRLQTGINNQISIFSLLSNIIKNEGISVFYKAASVTTAMIFINTTFHFYIFQEIVLYNKKVYRKKNNIPKENKSFLKSCLNINSIINHNKNKTFKECNRNISLIYFKSGFFAGFISSFIFIPFDNMRIRLISEKNLFINEKNKNILYKNNTILKLTSKIYSKEGIFGFFTGLNMSMIKESLGSALYFSTFEYIKNYLKYKNIFHPNQTFILTFISGGLAGMCNWTFTYPFDIIKTKKISEKEFNIKISFYNCVSYIYKNNGIFGFYKNFSAILFRSIIVNGFTLSIFDFTRKYFELE